MKKIRAIVGLFLLMVAGQTMADEHLVMQFNFENVNGREVMDPVSGITAKLMNQASVVEVGSRKVLDLGNGTGYLDMTKDAGAIVKALVDFTVSAYYRVSSDASLSGNGYFLWCFSRSAANSQTASAYTAYRLNAQRLATSKAGWGSEVGMEMGSASEKGRWTHVLYRQRGSIGELFIDGRVVQTNTSMPILSETFTAAPAYNWIGRPPFSGDSYLKRTLVGDFRLYDAAVSDEAVAAMAAETAAIESDFKYGTPGDFSPLTTALSECGSFVGTANEGYAPNAVAELSDMMSIAEAEVKAARASQTLIDNYVSQLQDLLAKAKATAGYSPKRTFEPSSDRGFRHPGGIVTQNDIDRAKKLLASGDTRIKRAWEILCANEYSSSSIATWPVETIIRGGSSGQNYMNVARGAAMAYQNALRWKIGGTRANADAAVRILMAWARGNKWVSGDTNLSLAAGIYGYELANAAELMRDYEGWSREDFEEFRQYMINTWYNPAIDFLRRRHDTWLNFRNASFGERPGHYWSNWGLCNALCVMSIGILCDDVHMYNQGVSFYKYDHVGTYKDRTGNSVILNDGCNEFIGNLVPVVHKDQRGPFGYLGQMQESGRDQGHALMALGLALDICTVGLNQGDDLFAYMDDRIAAGTEFVAAMNFGGVDATSLPWTNYNYADCRGRMGQGWQQEGPNTGGQGEYRPYWDRAIGYYEGLRGVRLPYAEKASEKVCPDGGGGNYSQNSGGFDHLGFSTLTSWRPAVDASAAITPLGGDIIYKGVTYKNQTNLGGLKYNYEVCPSKGIPADGSDITLMPQLPQGTEDNGQWLWNTGETTRSITVKADKSYIYRVSYTAGNGAVSHQAFAIAVAGDGIADKMTEEITVDGVIESTTEKTVLEGTSVILCAGPATGWTDDFLWDNGQKGSVVTIPAITTSRTYLCQYANQGGAVSESRFSLTVVPAVQLIDGTEATEAYVLKGSSVTLSMQIPAYAISEDVAWSDGTTGTTLTLDDIQASQSVTATFRGVTYTFNIYLKAPTYSYYNLLSTDKGWQLVGSTAQLGQLSASHYFVLASDEEDLLIGLADGKQNGNKALYYLTPADPLTDLSKLFTIESYGDAFCLRNVDYDGLLLQTEMDKPWNLRTHDQPYACEWTRLLFSYADASWTIENGKYPGNWLGLWTPGNGYCDGEEIALNKTGGNIARLQLFAIEKSRFHFDYVENAAVIQQQTGQADITPLLRNPSFLSSNGCGWTFAGSWGNQRYNGAAEVWHSTDFSISQSIGGLPDGQYTVSCQMANGEGANTGYLYATSGNDTQMAVVAQSCKGSDFDTQRDKMAANASYALLTVDILVTDGGLTLGVKEPSSNTTWLVFDNFTLKYNTGAMTGIEEKASAYSRKGDDAIYDLQGRRVTAVRSRGLYIRNGRKWIKPHSLPLSDWRAE